MRIRNIIAALLFSSLLILGQEESEVLKLISPNGGEILKIGERYSIAWYSENVDKISIYYTINNGENWSNIITGMRSDLGSYGWKIPNFITSKLKIKIESFDNTQIFDISSNNIYLEPINEIDLLNKAVKSSNSNILKILPLGNSITFDNRTNDTRPVEDKIGYRFPLYSILNDSNYSFDFIGSEHAGSNFFFPDIGFDDNAGFPGIKDNELEHLLKTGILNQPFYSINDTITEGPYLETYTPDIILLHIGTNGTDQAGGTLADDVENILDEIDRFEDSANVDITVFIARIINRVPNQSYVTTFNNNIENMVIDRKENPLNSAYPDNLFIVDIEGIQDFNYTVSPDPSGSPGDMNDMLHPNDKGFGKLAQTWFNSIEENIGEPVTIINQPSPVFAVVGDTAKFSISVSGKSPFTYQWMKDGTELLGKTDSVLSFFPVSQADNNSLFSCAVSNSFSNLNSDDAQLSTIIVEKPDQIFASLDTNKNIELSWRDNSDNEDGFLIKRSSSIDSTYYLIDTNIANNNFYVDTTVSDGIKYNYKISSFIEFGSIDSDEIFSLSIPLNEPTDLTAILNLSNNVLLNWEDNTKNEANYIIEGKADHIDSSFYKIDSVNSGISTYIDQTPKYFSPYIYRIYAKNEVTISSYSNTATVNVVGLEEITDLKPDTYSLSQNYPNPFNPETTIEYKIPSTSFVNLSIYNNLGELVSELVNKNQSSGIYNVEFDGSKLNSGIYFYVLRTSSIEENFEFRNVKKMLLLK